MTISVRETDFVRILLSRTNFPPSGPVACATSGGPDSMALVVLAVAAGLTTTAHHVDHGLRPESAAEANLVAEVCGRLGAEFVAHRVALDDGPNLEARARAARFAVLPAGVLTGHTADDQAETVLLNLMRGAGVDGLAGMRRSPRKPLLSIRRAETHELCRLCGIAVAVDQSNRDPRFRRNRVRHELIPLLDDIAQRDVSALLAREADLIADDEQFLDSLSAALDVHDARALAGAPLALARRAVRRWLSDPYPPDSATVERVLEVARGLHPSCDIGRGRRVIRSRQRLELR
ncbi:MAG: tRNA lysidine(34) synthetase TilS [Actinobacteria bacterium]|nr:tRNA lysidine(34) synthetase TilS [Actinomycetota bacterium]